MHLETNLNIYVFKDGEVVEDAPDFVFLDADLGKIDVRSRPGIDDGLYTFRVVQTYSQVPLASHFFEFEVEILVPAFWNGSAGLGNSPAYL